MTELLNQKTATGPMGHEIQVPAMEELDWKVLDFLDGPGGFGKDWKHPVYKFGQLNKFGSDTGRKLNSKYYSTISPEEYESFKNDYGIELYPVDDPPFDANDRLCYKELIWFKMTHQVARSIEKLNLRKALGHQPQTQAQADAWAGQMLARSRGKFSAKDLQVNSKVEDNIETVLASHSSETEKIISEDVEKVHIEASGPIDKL